jgi:hypothetical protein
MREVPVAQNKINSYCQYIYCKRNTKQIQTNDKDYK